MTGEAGDCLPVQLSSGSAAFVYAPLLGRVMAVSEPRVVWHNHSLKAGETFDTDKGHSQGSAFAIGPKTFVTAFHIAVGLHNKPGSLAAGTLEQEGGPARLKIKRVIAVHVAHDLEHIRF